MLNSVEQIIDAGLKDSFITDTDLANLFGGNNARRYALVNKATAKGELIQIRRGLYVLCKKYRSKLINNYALANKIVPCSFITAEYALSYHGWIPERVTQITSLIAIGRNKAFNTPYGYYRYHKTAIEPRHFLLGVERVIISGDPVFIASPLRALIDLVYWHKIKYADLNYITESLRIEEEYILDISSKDLQAFQPIYRSQHTRKFINNLQNEVINGQ